ncbi:hypothetical protein BVRB_8g194750 isoform A [Beta vulgaris subsp. vulgaris]|nr:hypothetical protein BVRB_8g194750 isoform A [Beta vulgaris subsp. vulgaris]
MVLPQDFMYRHFTLSWDNIRSGRIYTVLTSAFSHFDTIHFGKNMIGLLFFGGFIGKLIASEALLNVYLLGAIGGSLFYLLPQVNKNQEISGMDPLLGANGPVNSFVFLVMLLFPKRVWFQILIPVPARAAPIPVTVTATILGTIIVGMDLLSILQGDPHGTSAQLLAAAIATAGYII